MMVLMDCRIGKCKNNDLDSGIRLLRSYFTFFITFSLMLFNLEVSDACLIHRIQLGTSIDNVKYLIILSISVFSVMYGRTVAKNLKMKKRQH